MIIALNNKCNLTKDEFILYKKELQKLKKKETEIILFPSSIYLSNKIDNISIGSQNVSHYSSGPYTGEISAEQLKSLNVKYCLTGHSERREKFFETSDDINKKIRNLLNYEIIPILCIGEKKRSNLSKNKEIILDELKQSLFGLSKEEIEKIIIAYEPVWSIGTGIIPTGEEISEIINSIKANYPNNKILYGGSVNSDNVEMLNKENIIDGYLLGGLSLRLEKVQLLIDKIEN